MGDNLVFYGFPEECGKFDQRHPLWVECTANIARACNIAFQRVQVMEGPEDKFIYLFGRLIIEDFWEIALVAHHGYGIAASKLLRSMYEHTVTLCYLTDHRDEIQTFINYGRIQNEKLINRLIETFGEKVLPAKDIEEAREKAAEVKEDFMVPVCEHPGAKARLNHTWNRLDFVSMAKRTDTLGNLIVPGYYMPMRHAHATFGGLTERLEIFEGNMGLDPDSQPDTADQALMTAHNCLILALGAQKDTFKVPGLEEAIQVCLRDWVRIWSPESELLKPAI